MTKGAVDQAVPNKEEIKANEIARRAQKEKQYAPVPPEWIIQPSINGGEASERFKTGRLLGKGGFALAYEAVLSDSQSSKNRVFALKVVKTHMGLKKIEEKFRTELQIHAKMNHPNIVEFHRAFSFLESTYVVLELCSNGSVMDMVKRRKFLSLPESRRFMVQLCGAIKYMHSRNVIHRDLKMGNLFLDDNLNIKIGDFGLAAVLVSRDELDHLISDAKLRRTTLCGTPNYIAPEILEKRKCGHDHKVDIWAMGVILFAMITGHTPFQSTSQSEIYRRARSVEYAWPEEKKLANEVPCEAKDLVSRLLRIDAEERPDPDNIVGHPFFSMGGGDLMPAVLEQHCTIHTPSFLDPAACPRGDVMYPSVRRLSLSTLARQCGVGILPGQKEAISVVGADTDKTLYRICALEEAQGLSPVVPIPPQTIYISPYSSITNTVSAKSGVALNTSGPNRVPRSPAQSHAARLRAPPNCPQTFTNVGSDRRLLTELPVRPLRSNPRSREPAVTKKTTESVIKSNAGDPKKSILRDRIIDNLSPDPDEHRRHIATKTRARIAATIEAELSPRPNKNRTHFSDNKENEAHQSCKIRTDIQARHDKPHSILQEPRTKSQHEAGVLPGPVLEPSQASQYLSASKPDDILLKLKKLQTDLRSNLLMAHNHKQVPSPLEIEKKTRVFTDRPLVKLWVDYTNRFGIGYVMSDGTIGCLFNEAKGVPPLTLSIPRGEAHVIKRKTADYIDKHQLVPQTDKAVEFLQNDGDKGLRHASLPSSRFRIKHNSSGSTQFVEPADDTYDLRRRKSVFLWNNFAQYMLRSLFSNSDLQAKRSESCARKDDALHAQESLRVSFYQGLGNVSIFGFAPSRAYSKPGSIHPLYQFNFPDHTKIVLFESFLPRSSTRNPYTWIDYYYMGSAITTGATCKAERKDRIMLSYPLPVFMAGRYEDHDFSEDLRLTSFSKKIAFISGIIETWVGHGGLGRLGILDSNGARDAMPDNLIWQGPGDSKRNVWVSIGSREGHGQSRRETSKGC